MDGTSLALSLTPDNQLGPLTVVGHGPPKRIWGYFMCREVKRTGPKCVRRERSASVRYGDSRVRTKCGLGCLG